MKCSNDACTKTLDLGFGEKCPDCEIGHGAISQSTIDAMRELEEYDAMDDLGIEDFLSELKTLTKKYQTHLGWGCLQACLYAHIEELRENDNC